MLVRLIGHKLSFGFVPAPTPTTPEEFDRIVRADIETFTKVARLVGLRTK